MGSDAPATATLAVMRHADAEPGGPGQPDADRALTELGHRRAASRGAIVAQVAPQLILCSTAVRARQTLAALGDPGGTVQVEEGLYTASTTSLLLRLAEVAPDIRSVLVIGHMPTVAGLVDVLLTDHHLGGFAPAAIGVLEVRVPWAELAPGAATLRQHHP